MIKRLIFFIFCIIFIFSAQGYALRFPDDLVLDNLPQFIERLKRTAVLIVVTENKIIAGTGFLTIGDKNQILVITNAHVAKVGKPLFVRVNAPNKIIDYSAEIYRINESFDIAVLFLKKADQNQQWSSTDLAIPKEMFGSSIDILEGKEIVYIGYPLGLGVEEKNYPVSRQGLIAQAIRNRATFLIDGFVSHGNSGSPVFSRKDGKLIGMISSFEPDFIDSIENSKLISRVPFNSGISKVISIEAIKAVMFDNKQIKK